MQLFTVTSALFAALATAGPVSRDNALYEVHAFKASCEPHGANCDYQFNVYKDSNAAAEGHPGTSCAATVSRPPDGMLPAVTYGTCGQAGRTWTLNKNPDGSLTIVVKDSDPATGPIAPGGASHVIPLSDLRPDQDGQHGQVYIGKPDFSLYPEHH